MMTSITVVHSPLGLQLHQLFFPFLTSSHVLSFRGPAPSGRLVTKVPSFTHVVVNDFLPTYMHLKCRYYLNVGTTLPTYFSISDAYMIFILCYQHSHNTVRLYHAFQRGPLVSEETALPTELQPLPRTHQLSSYFRP